MAITRCPYCHAIIDENDKYCNNCGTQLLFPEDDEVDEEIPGEKILDAEVEEKDYTVDEPADEKKATGVVDLDEDLEEELEEQTEALALDKLIEEEVEDEDVTEEVILVDEIEAAEAGGEDRPEGPKVEEGTAEPEAAPKQERKEAGEESEDEGDEEEDNEAEEAEIEEGTEDEDEEEENEEPGDGEESEKEAKEETREYAPGLAKAEPPLERTDELPPAAEGAETLTADIPVDRERKEAGAATGLAAEPSPQPPTFDTGELEGIGRTVELSKDRIDKFLEVLAEKKAEPEPSPKPVQEPTGTLPPWASTMKGAPVFADESEFAEAGEEAPREGTAAAVDEETEIFPRRRDSDSTIGLPERVGQSPLPFEPAAAEDEEDAAGAVEPVFPPKPSRPEKEAPGPAREPGTRPLEAFEVAEAAEPRSPFSFSAFFKSKAFDVLFVGLFWLVALWLAADSLDTTIFDILGSMSGPMLLLYAVFVFIYFFLFKFFLGETLGDRLFRERDRS